MRFKEFITERFNPSATVFMLNKNQSVDTGKYVEKNGKLVGDEKKRWEFFDEGSSFHFASSVMTFKDAAKQAISMYCREKGTKFARLVLAV